MYLWIYDGYVTDMKWMYIYIDICLWWISVYWVYKPAYIYLGEYIAWIYNVELI